MKSRGATVAIGLLLSVLALALVGVRIAERLLRRAEGELCTSSRDCESGLCWERRGAAGLPSPSCTVRCESRACSRGRICVSTTDGQLCLPEPKGETGDRCAGPEDCVTALCAHVTSTVRGRFFARGYCVEAPLDGVCAERLVPISSEHETICMAMDQVELEEERYVRALDEVGSTPPPPEVIASLGRGRTVSLVPPP